MEAYSLESIPNELMLRILELAPDLPSLHHLILASPKASALFDRFGLTILESVLQRVVPIEILTLIRYCAHLRRCSQDKPPTKTFHEYIAKYLSFKCEQLDPEDIDDEFVVEKAIDDERSGELTPGEPLDDKSGGGGLYTYSPREILLLIRHVFILADACIDYYRDRCAKVRPGITNRVINMPELQGLPQVPYIPRDYGPPSWTEMQRTVRGLWRTQSLYQVQINMKPASMAGSGWAWEDVTSHTLYRGRTVQYWEVTAVVHFLSYNIRRSAPSKSFHLKYKLNGETLLRYIPNRPLEWPNLPIRPESNKLDNPEFRIQAVPHGYYFAKSLTGSQTFPMRANIGYGCFSGFGFAIWDKPRLHRMGLINAPEGQEQDDFNYKEDYRNRANVYTWLHFLGETLTRCLL